MSTVTSLFDQAQLAEAAYANFLDNSGNLLTNINDIKAALIAKDFSPIQATDFVTHWRVINQSPPLGLLGSGFSATVFESLDHPGQYSLSIAGSTSLTDFNADALLIATDGVAVSQLVDLYNYWQSLTHTGAYDVKKLVTQSLASAPRAH